MGLSALFIRSAPRWDTAATALDRDRSQIGGDGLVVARGGGGDSRPLALDGGRQESEEDLALLDDGRTGPLERDSDGRETTHHLGDGEVAAAGLGRTARERAEDAEVHQARRRFDIPNRRKREGVDVRPLTRVEVTACHWKHLLLSRSKFFWGLAGAYGIARCHH